MNHPDRDTASTLGKTARRSPVAQALFLGLTLLWSGGQAMADSGGYWLVASDGGISGVEVVVTKNPGGIRIVAEDAAGNSALRLDGPGDYTVSTVCRQACPAHSITGALRMPPAGNASPPIIAILMPILFPVKMVEGVQSSFNFTIKEAGTVVLSGVMPTTRGTVKPTLDVDGNGQRNAVTDGLLILRRSGIANAIERQPDNVLPGAAINTSRSNIKRPGITAENDSPQPSDRGIGVAVGDFDGDGRSMCCPASGEHFPRDILGIAGNPFVDLPIRLESDPGNIKVSANTDRTGAFHFGKLPAGKYKVILPNLQSQSLTVASDGIASGKVTRSNDGDINIFDRWGTLLASSGSSKDDTPAGNKVATKPGFEPPRSGFAGMGGGGPGILPGMGPGGPGPGPVSPSPGVMSPGGPAGPGGGAMRR